MSMSFYTRNGKESYKLGEGGGGRGGGKRLTVSF